MSKAFQAEKGDLTDPNQPESEREARYFLFAGAIGAYKNPVATEMSNSRQKKPLKLSSSRVISFGSLMLVREDFQTRQINLLNFHFPLTKRIKKLDNCHKKVGRLPPPQSYQNQLRCYDAYRCLAFLF